MRAALLLMGAQKLTDKLKLWWRRRSQKRSDRALPGFPRVRRYLNMAARTSQSEAAVSKVSGGIEVICYVGFSPIYQNSSGLV